MPLMQEEYNYDSIDAGYYDQVFKKNSGVQAKWHHLKFDHVRKALPKGYRHHLDVGCGPGTFIGTLPQEAESIGVDLAGPQIQYAQENYQTDKHRFRQVGHEALPFADETFDLVTMIELIEHLPMEAVKNLLDEARRVLKPGGCLVVTTPNYGSLWPLLEKALNARAEVSYEEQHITFLKRKSLRVLLHDRQFEDVSVGTFLGAAPFAAALGWKLATMIDSVETPLVRPFMGFLLLATARKRGSDK